MLYIAELQTFVLLLQTTLSLSSGSEQVLLSSRALVANQPKGWGVRVVLRHVFTFSADSL